MPHCVYGTDYILDFFIDLGCSSAGLISTRSDKHLQRLYQTKPLLILSLFQVSFPDFALPFLESLGIAHIFFPWV